MSTPEQRIRAFYGFDFPEDFFRYREFLARLGRDDLDRACTMRAGFPFAVASGQADSAEEDRYYHDLPEFITLFGGEGDGHHFGYFFDAPGELPPIVAAYWHSDTFQHYSPGDTIFEAVRNELEVASGNAAGSISADPTFYGKQLEVIAEVRALLSEFWGADRVEVGDEYADWYDASASRDPVAETWSDLGIVVPENWYRPLSDDPITRRPVAWSGDQVAALAAEALSLLHHGYCGAALKLGHDLWCWAQEYPVCYDLLEAAYTALDRALLLRLLNEARAFREHCDHNRR